MNDDDMTATDNTNYNFAISLLDGSAEAVANIGANWTNGAISTICDSALQIPGANRDNAPFCSTWTSPPPPPPPAAPEGQHNHKFFTFVIVDPYVYLRLLTHLIFCCDLGLQ